MSGRFGRMATDASASAGADLRYDAIKGKDPWLVVIWPEGKERRFATKQEAYDYLKSVDQDEFWDEGDKSSHERLHGGYPGTKAPTGRK